MELFGTPLIYVWRGELPRYAPSALRIARRNFPHEIILLSDSDPGVHGIRWFSAQHYASDLSQRLSSRFQLDRSFRNGLWWKAYERFFILWEFARRHAIGVGFHAELDNLILDLGGFEAHLDSHGSGVFFPQSAPNVVNAALVYWNNLPSLESVAEYLAENGGSRNEMNVLAEFLRSGKADVFSFATEQVWDEQNWPYSRNPAPIQSGIVDATGIGMWLFGRGPATTRCTIWNKARPGSGSTKKWPIENLRFRSLRTGGIEAVLEGFPAVNLRSIHVSAKCHSFLTASLGLKVLLLASRLPFRIPIYPRTYCLERALLVSLGRRLFLGRTRLQRFMVWVVALQLATYSIRREIDIPQKISVKLTSLGVPKSKSHSRVMREICRDLNELEPNSVATRYLRTRFRVPLLIIAVSGSPDWDTVLRNIHPWTGDVTHAQLDRIGPDIIPLLLGVWKIESTVLFIKDYEISAPLLELKGRTSFVTPRKNVGSMQHARNLWAAGRDSPSWNFSTEVQAYEPKVLANWWRDTEEVVNFWLELKSGGNPACFEDYYAVRHWTQLKRGHFKLVVPRDFSD